MQYKKLKKIAEKRLYDFPNYEKEIERRKIEIIKSSGCDLNYYIKSNYKSSSVETIMETIDTDIYIQNMIIWKDAVLNMLNALDDETQRDVVRSVYFERIEDDKIVSQKHELSVTTIKKICDRACSLLLIRLGECLKYDVPYLK